MDEKINVHYIETTDDGEVYGVGIWSQANG